MLPDGAEFVLFCVGPPNRLLGPCELKSDEPPPPNAGVDVSPFFAGAGADAPNGLLLTDPTEKLKPLEEGGWGLKLVPGVLVPKAGKEEFEKLLLGAGGCAGGKLLVVPAPKTSLLPLFAAPKPVKELVPFSPGAGDPKPPNGLPKLALCDMPEDAPGRRGFTLLILRAAICAAVARLGGSGGPSRSW